MPETSNLCVFPEAPSAFTVSRVKVFLARRGEIRNHDPVNKIALCCFLRRIISGAFVVQTLEIRRGVFVIVIKIRALFLVCAMFCPLPELLGTFPKKCTGSLQGEVLGLSSLTVR